MTAFFNRLDAIPDVPFAVMVVFLLVIGWAAVEAIETSVSKGENFPR